MGRNPLLPSGGRSCRRGTQISRLQIMVSHIPLHRVKEILPFANAENACSRLTALPVSFNSSSLATKTSIRSCRRGNNLRVLCCEKNGFKAALRLR